jgi:hypothetical protein
MTEPRNIPGTGLTYRDGSIVRFRQGTLTKLARVTCIYTTMEPPRWDGVLLPSDALQSTEDNYPDEGGMRIWANESDIVAVKQP